MQILMSAILDWAVMVTEHRQTIGHLAALALGLLAAFASWQLTDVVVARMQRVDEK